MYKVKNYIDGKMQGFSDEYLSIYNPSTGEIEGEVILSNEKVLLKKKIHKKDLEEIFEKDFKKALNNFNNKLKFLTSNKKEAELLIEMIFQLGIKNCLNFKNLIKNMRKSNKYLVCFEMMDSLWYKQTPHRVKTLIKSFLNND